MRTVTIAVLLAGVAGAQAEGYRKPDFNTELLAQLAKPPVHIIGYDPGGSINRFIAYYQGIDAAGYRIEMRGSCESACTLVLSIAKDRICFADGAQLRFHMPRYGDKPAPDWAAWMYREYPTEVRAWIDSKGGHAALPMIGYWTLPATELWKMGYRKCQ